MKLSVLNVAYPLAPVGPDAVGGAEQVLTRLDAALTEAGHDSRVVASEGSRASGHLLTTRPCARDFSEAEIELARARHRKTIQHVLDNYPVDLVHLHGVDFSAYLPPSRVPVLVTLHLPPSWYPPEIFSLERPQTFLHCVSQTQQAQCPAFATLLPVIQNGVDIPARPVRQKKRSFVLAAGRICPEKGFHIALDAATRAHVPLLLAGQVFPYAAHLQYFESEIRPRMNNGHRFLGPLGFQRKSRFLSNARCLLAASLVPETSSLIAMEALAAGTPVIAFRAGALSEIIEDGKTGFLVDSEKEMAEAIHAVHELDPEDCRDAAVARFSATRMTGHYLDLYSRLAANRSQAPPKWPAQYEFHHATDARS